VVDGLIDRNHTSAESKPPDDLWHEGSEAIHSGGPLEDQL